MKTVQKKMTGRKAGKVSVRVGGKEQPQNAEGFRMCPLGIQFVTDHRLNAYDLFEFSLDLDELGRKAKVPTQCTGAVVKCRKQPGQEKFKVWIHFLDVPGGAKERIECISKNGKHLCHYCSNY